MYLMTIVQRIAAVKNRMFPWQFQEQPPSDELQMQATCGQWLLTKSVHLLTLKASMVQTRPNVVGCK